MAVSIIIYIIAICARHLIFVPFIQISLNKLRNHRYTIK